MTAAIGTTSVPVDGAETRVVFTAPKRGKYTFSSVGSQDTIGFLYTGEGRLLDSNDDYAGDRNFSITKRLEEGDIVLVGVRYYDETASGTISLVISFEESEPVVGIGVTPVQINGGLTIV